ncbi:MAG: endonuclease [Chloroflexia bacterium]|jgi:endonuclease-3|nr:endonuclease [Chloroflexia bacterium]
MPHLDTHQREKWPAPNPGPPLSQVEREVDVAREEAAAEPLRAKARAVLALLREEYGEPNWPVLDPLGTLIETLLSHRTADPQTWAAYNELKRRWPTWEELADAPVEEIREAVSGTTWPEQKGPRVKALLQRVKAERGNFDLSFLYDIPVDEANAWLQSLGGVGPKTAACVLLFACRRPVLPVDTHVHRVSIRLGLIDEKMSADEAHAVLPTFLPDPSSAPDILAFHRNMLLHGQRICVWRDPKCPKCVVRDWCDYYAAHPEKQAQAGEVGQRKGKRSAKEVLADTPDA